MDRPPDPGNKVPNAWGTSSSSPLLVTREFAERARRGGWRNAVVRDYKVQLTAISIAGQNDLHKGPFPGFIDNDAVAHLCQLNPIELHALKSYGSPFKDETHLNTGPVNPFYMGTCPLWGAYGNGWVALTSALHKLPAFGALGLDLPLFRVERKKATLFLLLRTLAKHGQCAYVAHGRHVLEFGQKHLVSTSLMASSHSVVPKNYKRGLFRYRCPSARYMNNFSVQGMLDGGEALILPGVITFFDGQVKQIKWMGQMVDVIDLVEVNKGELDSRYATYDDFDCTNITDWAKGEGYYRKTWGFW